MNWRERLRTQVSPESAFGGITALAALVLLAAILYGLKPAWAEYRAARIQRAETEAPDPEEIARQNERLSQVEAEIRVLRDALYGGAAGVPTREIEAFVIDSLDALAHRQRVALLGVDPGQPSEFLSFQELPYEIRLVGRYTDLFAWLGQVETELRPMIVKELRLRGDPADERVRMEMRLVAYRAERTP